MIYEEVLNYINSLFIGIFWNCLLDTRQDILKF